MPMEPSMPRDPSPAQVEASRRNGRRSHGPVTPEGKARAAINARTFGLRSSIHSVIGDEDLPHYEMLRDSIHDHFQPASPLEAALCARMVTALWRAERAEQLERAFWCATPPGAPDEPHLQLQMTLVHDQDKRRASLPTALRYLAEANNAFARALRNLTQLRSGKADPLAENPFVPSDGDPATPLNFTNEPENGCGPDRPDEAGSRRSASPNEPGQQVHPVSTNEPKNRRSPEVPGEPEIDSSDEPNEPGPFCTNEPEPILPLPLGPDSCTEPGPSPSGSDLSSASVRTNEPELPSGPARDAAHSRDGADESDRAGNAAGSGSGGKHGPGAAPGSGGHSSAAMSNRMRAVTPPAANDHTNEPEPDTPAGQALRELAHLRSQIARRFDLPYREAAEAYLLRFGVDGKGPPAWLRDLPPSVARAG